MVRDLTPLPTMTAHRKHPTFSNFMLPQKRIVMLTCVNRSDAVRLVNRTSALLSVSYDGFEGTPQITQQQVTQQQVTRQR